MNYSLQVFDYNGSPLRTLEMDNEVWFVAKDVCDVLKITDAETALRSLDNTDVLMQGIVILGSRQNVLTISEAGFYALVFKSVYPQSKDFSRWVTHEVLPKLRKAAKTERFTRSIMSAARMILTTEGLKGSKLALALDKVAQHYTGESMLALSGITIEANDA